jgi:hypothetical protein
MYPIAEGVVSYFKKFAREDGLLAQVNEKWNLVVWPDNLRDGYDFSLTRPVSEDCHNVLNAFYYGCIQAVQQIKSILSRLNCGVYMAYFLLKALAVHGETELVYELITCKDDRSWSNMVTFQK